MFFFFAYSSLVYVEADTSLRQYEDAEGKKNTQLSLVQRECPIKTSRGKARNKTDQVILIQATSMSSAAPSSEERRARTPRAPSLPRTNK